MSKSEHYDHTTQPDEEPASTDRPEELQPGQVCRLTHAVHVDSFTLPAHTPVRVVSVHRLHVRGRVDLPDQSWAGRLPREALESA